MTYFLDIECYRNYFLVSFLREDGVVKHFELHNDCKLDIKGISKILSKGLIITFNGNHYDMPMLHLAMIGADNNQLKTLSDSIINGAKTWGMDKPQCNHVDIKEPSPGVMTGLKTYGGRLKSEKLQDLPLSPDSLIKPEQRELMRKYCVNDLETTKQLYLAIEKDIVLRGQLSEQYGVDVRSKSDAQIAESVFKSYLTGQGVNVRKRSAEVKPFKYKVPEWLEFKSPVFVEMLERVKDCVFEVSEAGKPKMPAKISKAIQFDGASYKFGIGGLHSQEKRQAIDPTTDELLGEFDIGSMYPTIIIEQKLFPAHLGKGFLSIYSDIKNTRIKVKKSDPRKAQTYKIVLNGSYGKFGSPYSFLYSPELLIQTTITGQLFLLMTIEKVVAAGGKVVSANTDGINVLYNKRDKLAIESAILDCELLAGYDYEYTPYLATYNRDVNNYIAIKPDGVKGKGAFAIGGLTKNPTNNICVEAIIEHLKTGKPIADVIESCKDITKFLTLRKVTGGAIYKGDDIGGVIRFYHSTVNGVITYKKNGNKVPKSENCKPMMNLPNKLPLDIDFKWYIKDAEKQLIELGVNHA